MSTRVNWTTVDAVGIEIMDDPSAFSDQYGSVLEPGNVGVLLAQDQDCLMVEGMDLNHLLEFARRLENTIYEAIIAKEKDA